MSENSPSEPQDSQSVTEIQVRLGKLADALRDADHLQPESQRALASLLDELGMEFGSSGLTSESRIHLADAVSDVARSLQEQNSAGMVSSARDRLKEAAVRAEIEAPVASGVVYRLLDVLSGIGI